jgi:hypothetical protein
MPVVWRLVPTNGDESKHPAGPERLWSESWYFDFAAPDGSLGGYVRLGLYPNSGAAWYWATLVGDGRPLLLVRDHEVPLPKGDSLEIRSEALWADLNCETPHEHWSMGLEAFAVGLDDPADAYHGERGDRVGLGFDLEWEAISRPYDYPGMSRYEQPCRVHGEILVGRNERIEFDGIGQRDHSWGVRDWWSTQWCWTSGRLDDGTAFHAMRPDTELRYEPGYTVPPGGDTPTPIDGFDLSTRTGDEQLPETATMRIGPLHLEVTARHHAPLLLETPEGDGRTPSRFPRALCDVRNDDGRTGVSWTEWLQRPSRA